MKKITYLLKLFVLLFSVGASAQGVTIGTGTDSNYYGPISGFWSYGATEMIYLGSEIGITGNITSIGWDVAIAGTTASNPVEIYMKTTSNATFANTGYVSSTAGYTLVYSGSGMNNVTGYQTIALNTPFTFSSLTDNLSVLVLNKTGSYPTTYPTFKFTAGTDRKCAYYYSNTVWASGTSGMTTSVNRYNVKIGMGTCFAPSNVAISNITTTTATASWTAPSTAPADGYEYYLSTSSTAPTAATTGVAATGLSANLATLPASTVHYLWVRSNCGSGAKSDWSSAATFATACNPSGDFTEGFETTATGTVMPTCWNKKIVSSSTASYVYVSGSDFNTGAKALRMGNSDAATATLYSVTPSLSALSAGTHRLKFYAKGDPSITFQVGTMSDPSDASTFTLKQTIALTANHQQFVVNFNTTTTDNYIAFKATYSNSYYFVSIDDVVWEPAPSCLEPSGLTIANITTNSASLSWTGVANATLGYDYYMSTTNTAPTTSTPVTGSTATGVTTASLTLSPSTTYYVCVRSKCSATDTSAWTATAVTFNSACASVAVPSAVEGFEVTTPLPNCWTTELITGTTNWTVFAPTGTGDIATSHSGTKVINKPYTDSNALLFSTPFDYSAMTTGTRVNVWLYRHASAAATDRYRFFVNTSKSLTGATQIFELFLKTTIAPTATATGWYNYTFDIPASVNGQSMVYVIVQGTTANGFSSYTLGMDDFKIESTLGTDSFDFSKLSAYPNPVKNVLNLSYSQDISDIAVFNLLGQQVLAKKVNAAESQIDMSNLTQGTYLVKVTVENQVKTIKVIKE